MVYAIQSYNIRKRRAVEGVNLVTNYPDVARQWHPTKNGDETMCKLANWLLKRDKIDLGSMAYSIRRLIENCDNEMLQHFKEHISDLNNREFILSQNFLQICKLISTRYRNGGVHEKIVTYDICTEAFENILMNGKNYIKELADI